MESQKKSSVLKWSLILAIIIVLNLFFNYALSVIYKSPDFEAFCPTSQINEAIADQKQCIDMGGQWNGNVPKVADIKTGEAVAKGYCDTTYTCRNTYESAQKVYDKNVFIALVILGVISLGLGFMFASNEVISHGLSLGGVFSFIIASMRYWSSADDLIKVVILGIALLALIYLAYRKFGSKS
jgi:hypothetical protein